VGHNVKSNSRVRDINIYVRMGSMCEVYSVYPLYFIYIH
jgi:hypothetical protein